MDLPDRPRATAILAARVRTRVRSRLPFELRVAVRRAPAIVSWAAGDRGLRRGAALPEVVCRRSSPLRRLAVRYADTLQLGKEQNVARVVRALDGVVLDPGAALSWNAEVGPPLRIRGFVAGPELHDGVLAEGIGGGACQVANLVFWLAVHAGLEIVERHRHALDLFPDDGRDVPFGLGATVFWPTRDLVVRNPHPVPVRFGFGVDASAVHGALTASAPLGARWDVVETEHRYERQGTEIWRCNLLVRREHRADGIRETALARHRARVCYPLAPEIIVERA